jgi:glucosyl-dolichyl phosphate glucuronosyltransferase
MTGQTPRAAPVAPDVSVIICTYTAARWDDLVAAVESVRRQTISPLEIIVVIDHNEELLGRVQAHMPDVVVVENREARGSSGARNSGVAAARGEIVAFLDDDATAAPDWLQRLTEGLADPQVLGVGGFTTPVWPTHRPYWFPEEFDWVVGCTHRGMREARGPVRNLILANMCFRREVFEVIGGFRSEIGPLGASLTGAYRCEDTEFCIRAQLHWPSKIWLYEPRAVVHHRVPASRARWDYFLPRCYAEGLSKARVTRLVGPAAGLASERTYTLRTLPCGVIQGIGDALFRGDITGFARAGAIVAGLMITLSGYLGTTLSDLAAIKAKLRAGAGRAADRRAGSMTADFPPSVGSQQ